MSEMKFKFTIQKYQTEAVDSIVKVFAGQPFQDKVSYRRDLGTKKIERDIFNYKLSDEELYMGFANAPVALDHYLILKNIQNIQADNNIKQSSDLSKGMGACSLDVEMETGTGKTYVYIKSMFELNKLYGWSKFIVVVPSIAIREGVRKSFETMQDHFMEYYGKKARFFVYNSKNLTDIDNFSSSADLSVMIINVQAFNARGKDARRIRMELDEFGSRRPIDVIQANRPIVIMDEPQKMGGAATQDSLKEFKPLFTMNFSATHKDHHDLVYVLDAYDAYKKKLVKKIEVKGFEIKNLQGQNGYVYIEDIIVSPTEPPKAKLEYEVSGASGIKRKTKVVEVDDDLYALSGHMNQYIGYHVSGISPMDASVSFTNGLVVRRGEVTGDANEKDVRRIQIRETIRSHFEKESELFEKGIKTLSLFFIDKVENYRKYDEDGNEVNSEYGDMFEEEYENILNENLSLFDTPYQRYLRSIDVHATHAGYFSIDKKGHKVNPKLERGEDTSGDVSAYDLILKDKEKLLSLDTPVRFIFSHSALREGWDNPNVFQICTLKHGGDSSTNKRQEVGRGLRICVNSKGDRMDESILGEDVQKINKLTVIASEGYANFVSSLQEDIRKGLYERPTLATANYFTDKRIKVGDKAVTITKEQANTIMWYLSSNGYIEADGKVSGKYREAVATKTLAPLPETNGVNDIADGVHKLVQGIFDEYALDGMIENGSGPRIRENNLNENFSKEEFKKLWNTINHKYTYTVSFDSEELINNAIQSIDANLAVSQLEYVVTVGSSNSSWGDLNSDPTAGFTSDGRRTYVVKVKTESNVKYDLVGKIAEGTHLTRKTIVAILKGISSGKFEMFKDNPEEFISKVTRLIEEQKGTMVVSDITYNKTDGVYDSAIFTAEKNRDYSKSVKGKKNVQDYLFPDSEVERKFAEEMDLDDKVVVYAKLPRGFQIPTPVGNYAPDWAIAFKKGSVKHVFFVAETKGTMSSLELKPIEQAKIECAKKLFAKLSTEDIVYQQVDTYEHLLTVMKAI